ncbi:MAG TPA: Rieske 2Fe-2S domain-containing protein [Alphaproteobacteria bacterium]|jgi:5,5'-dehydrodivanillate O-demethylase
MTPEENLRLTRVGPGTPCGEMLRRYWWPISFTEELARGKSLPVRVLGEDLILYRDGAGRLGLLDERCPHRGASLQLGRVEEDGIRCCYHGWKFDGAGRCLDMPCEPPGSVLQKEVRQVAYRTEEAGGLIFAYMGPEPVPAFPRYDLLFQEGLHRTVSASLDHCNWLQRAENTVDQLHATVLHAAGYPELALQRADIEWTKTPHGIRAEYAVDGGQGKVSHFVFPSANRYFGARKGERPSQNMHFRTPKDDLSTITFAVRTYEDPEGKGSLTTRGLRVRERGVYERVEDGWWGIVSNEQDRAAQESQGLIADRTREILGSSDRGVVMFRRMLSDAIKSVETGDDPPGVIREHTNAFVGFDASQQRDGKLIQA